MSSFNEGRDPRQESLESIPTEKKPVDRVVLFVLIVLIASGAAFGLWIRYGIGVGMSAGAAGGSSSFTWIVFLWAAIIAVSAVLLFRKKA